MSPSLTGRTRPTKPKKQARSLKRKREGEDVELLARAVAELDPKDGRVAAFSDLPLSRPTTSGLEASHFKTLTDIQAKAIPFALKGIDCLGAAKTGSGKTLAFLVPVLECLYRERWTELDGLGALIISPTRELAIQIFEVLRKIGRFHGFSAGLVIGGKSLQEERERLSRMNILVCTPGRMLQHMDQTAAFEVSNLQMLVLDEADRILDMGFQSTVDAIVEHLPSKRQSLLFSATQTKKVSDLARLSLKDPEYLAVHEAATAATPSTLQQHYVITPLPEKLNTLFSFLRSNVKAKILVFMSSGKQVRFVYQAFRHLQPGIPLLHLHGRQKQTARLDVTSRFSAAKNSCLFATDVVARGLDFPAVDWVLQLDCPEDADTYIHRVGRTARFERDGRAVLFLDPSEEEGMLERLSQKKVPVERINVRQKKQQSIQNQLQNMCFKNPELKHLGQKAFISYAKSIFVQKDKGIFKIDQLQMEEYSASLGLPGAPRIRFLKGLDARKFKNAPREQLSSDDEGAEDEEYDGEKKRKDQKNETVKTRYDRMFERQNQDIFTDHYSKLMEDEEEQGLEDLDPDEDGDFLTVKRRLYMDDADQGSSDQAPFDSKTIEKRRQREIPVVGKQPLIVDSKRREKLLTSKKKLLKFKGTGTKLVFDDEGEAHPIYELEDEESFRRAGDAESQRNKFLEQERELVKDADALDKRSLKEKRREKREKRKARAAEMIDEDDEGVVVQLKPFEGATSGDALAAFSDADSAIDEEQPRKRPKKWFEDDSDNDRARTAAEGRQRTDRDQEPQSLEDLEDLEAFASGLLN
ncbi:MAG: ATP-dependent RNA helicase dbp4 [Piccolia ochrophora]|nr:MAG: ATP-dependent RNA helicase dbp4 [Piccolia ochrophora]